MFSIVLGNIVGVLIHAQQSAREGYLGPAAAVFCSARTSHLLAAQLMAIDTTRPFGFSNMDNSDSDSQDNDDSVSLRSERSDTSSEVTELDQTDFPGYFQERRGRLFHSHGTSPYPLPVDTAEQQVRASHLQPWQHRVIVAESQQPAHAGLRLAQQSPLSRSRAPSSARTQTCVGLVHRNRQMVSRGSMRLTFNVAKLWQGGGHGARIP